MHHAVTSIQCIVLAILMADSALAQGLSGFDVPAPLNTNAAMDAGGDRAVGAATDGQGAWVAVWVSTNTFDDAAPNASCTEMLP